MSKEREMYGIKVIVDNETYNEYKGTLEEQIEELQERIDKAIEYIEYYTFITFAKQKKDSFFDYDLDMEGKEKLLEILKGSDK